MANEMFEKQVLARFKSIEASIAQQLDQAYRTLDQIRDRARATP